MKVFRRFSEHPKPDVPEYKWTAWRGETNGIGFYRWLPLSKMTSFSNIELPRYSDLIRAAHSDAALRYFGDESIQRFLASPLAQNNKGFLLDSKGERLGKRVRLTGLDIIDSWLRKPELWDEELKMHSAPIDGTPYILHQNNSSKIVTGRSSYAPVSSLLYDKWGGTISHMTISLLIANTFHTGFKGTMEYDDIPFTEYSGYYLANFKTEARGEKFYVPSDEVSLRRNRLIESGITDNALLWSDITTDGKSSISNEEAIAIIRKISHIELKRILHLRSLGVGFDAIAASSSMDVDDEMLVSLSGGWA